MDEIQTIIKKLRTIRMQLKDYKESGTMLNPIRFEDDIKDVIAHADNLRKQIIDTKTIFKKFFSSFKK